MDSDSIQSLREDHLSPSEAPNQSTHFKKKCRLLRLASDSRVSYETELPLKIEGRMMRGFLADKAMGSINRMHHKEKISGRIKVVLGMCEKGQT